MHVLFWGLSFYFIGTYFSISSGLSSIDFIYSISFHICLFPLVYSNLSFLVPRLLQTGKYLWYFLALVCLITVTIFIHELVFGYLVPTFLTEYYIVSFVDTLSLIRIFTIYLIVTSLLKFSKSWFRIQQLEKERMNLELKSLKSQLNPHFLFNGLNNIYALSLQKSDKTSEAILKLSNLLRYTLYEINKEEVSLEQELDNLEYYISLQKLRLKTPSFIHFDISGNTQKVNIAPMILLPILENVFKHGDLSKEVNIELTVEEYISFFCENYIGDKDHPTDSFGGIGLENIKRRLDLLYPDHQLAIKKENEKFCVSLKIPS